MAKTKTVSARNIHESRWVAMTVILVIGFIGGFLLARSMYKWEVKTASEMVAMRDRQIQAIKADKVMKMGGEMMVQQQGVISVMEDTVTMSDGTKVMKNGGYTRADGSKHMLGEGESMDMDGRMMPSETPGMMSF